MYDMYGGAIQSSPKKSSPKKSSPKKSSPTKSDKKSTSKTPVSKRCSSSNSAYVKWKASAPKGAKCIAHSEASNRSEANTRNKRAVLKGTAFKTASGLTKNDIKLNRWLKPVSIKASAAATKRFNSNAKVKKAFADNRHVLKGAYSGTPQVKRAVKKSTKKSTMLEKKKR